MIRDKVIKIFDVESIREGDVLAYCFTDVGDDGEIVDGKWKNGIVSHVAERTLTIINVRGHAIGITINDIETDRVRVIEVHRRLTDMVYTAAKQGNYLKLD